MNLLLDTHVLIWWGAGTHLDTETISQIRNADQVWVSAVVAWEIAIKTALGRFRAERSVADITSRAGFEPLPVYFHHAEMAAMLPMHHRDPFDRMLAAQAMADGLTLVTRDPVFLQYDMKVLKA